MLDKEDTIGAIAETLTEKADKDLGNLESGANINLAECSCNVTNCLVSTPKNIFYSINNGSLSVKAGSKAYYPDGFDGSVRKFTEVEAHSDLTLTLPSSITQDEMLIVTDATFTGFGYRPIVNCQSGTTDPAEGSGINYFNTDNNTLIAYNASSASSRICMPLMNVKVEAGIITKVHEVFDWYSYNGNVLCTFPGITGVEPDGLNPDNSLKGRLRTSTTVRFLNVAAYTNYNCCAAIYCSNDTDIAYYERYVVSENAPSTIYTMWFDTRNNILNRRDAGDYSRLHGFEILTFDRINGKISNVHPKKVYRPVDVNETDYIVSFQRPTAANNYAWYRKYASGWVEQGGHTTLSQAGTATVTLLVPMLDINYQVYLQSYGSSLNANNNGNSVSARTTMNFTVASYNNNADADWIVKGIAAN